MKWQGIKSFWQNFQQLPITYRVLLVGEIVVGIVLSFGFILVLVK